MRPGDLEAADRAIEQGLKLLDSNGWLYLERAHLERLRGRPKQPPRIFEIYRRDLADDADEIAGTVATHPRDRTRLPRTHDTCLIPAHRGLLSGSLPIARPRGDAMPALSRTLFQHSTRDLRVMSRMVALAARPVLSHPLPVSWGFAHSACRSVPLRDQPIPARGVEVQKFCPLDVAAIRRLGRRP